MTHPSSKREDSPNRPDGDDVFTSLLDAMSISELTEALNHTLEEITEENYDPALIDAYLNALDRKNPMPEMPTAKTSYAHFQKKLHCFAPRTRSTSHRLRRTGRVALVASLAIICVLGLMVIAQAAGIDVFGTMARWTDEVFSHGSVRSNGVGFVVPEEPSEYSTLQDALEAYQVTEVSAPTWVPDEYMFDSLDIEYLDDIGTLSFYAEYSNGNSILMMTIASYSSIPTIQIEKDSSSVEFLNIGETTVYLLENNNNQVATWATNHFECIISGSLEKSQFEQMILSALVVE